MDVRAATSRWCEDVSFADGVVVKMDKRESAPSGCVACGICCSISLIIVLTSGLVQGKHTSPFPSTTPGSDRRDAGLRLLDHDPYPGQ